MITKESLDAAIENLAGYHYGTPPGFTLSEHEIRGYLKAGANHLAPALIVLAEALDVAHERIIDLDRSYGSGSYYSLNEIIEAKAQAAKLLQIDGSEG